MSRNGYRGGAPVRSEAAAPQRGLTLKSLERNVTGAGAFSCVACLSRSAIDYIHIPFEIELMSHPTVRVHQKFLSPSQSELNISPDTILGKTMFVPPDRHLYALVLRPMHQYTFHPNRYFLTQGISIGQKHSAQEVQPLPWVDSY